MSLPAAAVRLAPFRLDRVAGVSVTALDISGPVRARLDEHDAAAAVVDAAAGPLVDAIFAVVPRHGKRERRRLLALKRLVHGRGALAPGDSQFLADCGVPDLELKTWLEACRDRARARALLAAAVTGSAGHTARLLRRQAGTGALALALPLVARDFAARAQGAGFQPGSRAARTALLYLVRAALKPSPLSHLTTVSLYPSSPAHGSQTGVPAGFAHSLFTELAATPRFTSAFRYVPAYPVPADDGRALLVLAAVQATGEFLWHSERVADASSYTREITLIREAAESPGGFGSLPPLRLARYTRMGLVVPVVPWRPGAAAPLRDLATAVRGSTAADAGTIADRLDALDADTRALATAGAAERLRRMPGLRRNADELASACGASRWPGMVVHEDVTAPGPAGPLPAAVEDDLRKIARELRPFLFRSHLYDLIVAEFRARYGPGGRCGDAAAFFLRLQASADFRRRAREAKACDLGTDVAGSDRACLPVGRTSAPPAAAVLYQIAACQRQAILDGDYLLVVNQFGSALGGLISRYGRALGTGAVAGTLLPWLQGLFPGCQVRSMSLSAQVNNLQHAGCGYLPEIAWPAERQERPAGAMTFDELALAHDAGTDTVEFTDGWGSPVAPVYTGIVPANLCSGAPRLALAVMDPWVDGSPLTRANHPFLRSRSLGELTDGGTAEPRATDGRVVLQRARWLFPATAFPVPGRAEDCTGYLVRLDRWRRDRGLPREVFFLAISADPLDASRRKPMWLDFASAHSVRTALPLIAGSLAVRIEEALPDRTQAWVAGGDGPRVCEHTSFVAWERPGRGPG